MEPRVSEPGEPPTLFRALPPHGEGRLVFWLVFNLHSLEIGAMMTDEVKAVPEKTDREKHIHTVRTNKTDQEAAVAARPAVGDAEQGLMNAEARLAADPNNRALKDDVELKRKNLEKAKRT